METQITVVNNTNQPWVFTLFTKPESTNRLATKVMSNAWRVLSLGVNQSMTVEYEALLSVGVQEPQFNNRLTSLTADLNDVLDFTTYGSVPEYYGRLEETANRNTDGTITVNNKSASKVDVSLRKNGLPLLTFKDVGEGNKADFNFHPKIYLLWGHDFVETEIISGDISSQAMEGFSLENVKTLTLTVTEDQNTGKISVAPQILVAQ